jgi:hypothetical protein
MRRLGVTAVALSLATLAAASCGTDANGIDACRSIEQARCRRAPSCPTLGISGSQGVEECAQFARDRCLHGLAVADPGGAVVNDCVNAIASDTTCAIVAQPETAPACAFLLTSPPAADASTDAAAGSDSADEGG